MSAAKVTGKVLLGAGLVAVGWIARDVEFNAHRYGYSDVLVVARHDSRHFTLQPARMQPWETGDLCSEVDWQVGQKMKRFAFQQRKTCKDVAERGEVIFYTENGKRIIFNDREEANAGY